MPLIKPKSCLGCPLYDIGYGFSIPEGTGFNKVLVVGEALGKNEAYFGTPFVKTAESGSCLEDVFRRLKVQREDFLLYNIVNCQPPNNELEGEEYEESAVNHCRIYLDFVVKEYKPKVIVAAGNLPLKYLTNYNGKASDKQSITMLRGYICEGFRYKNIPVIPTLHPSFVNRMGRKHIGILMRDVGLALEIAKENNNGKYNFKSKYNTNPNINDLRSLYNHCRNNPKEVISYDIETPYTKEGTEEFEYEKGSSEITQIQFSIKKGEAIVIDTKQVEMLWYNIEEEKWELNKNEWYNLIKNILELPNNKLSWNGWDFDSHILELNGIYVNNDIDLMWLYHHINPDIKGNNGMALGFAANLFAPELPPWKHLMGEDIGYYGGLDVDSLIRIYPELINNLKNFPKFNNESKSLYEGVTDDVIKLWPILVKMTKRGLPIDLEYQAKFIEEVKTKLEETKEFLRKVYPEELRNRKPIEGFVNPPTDLKETLDNFETITNINNNNSNLYLFSSDTAKANYRNKYIEENTRRTYKTGTTEKQYSGLVIREFNINGVKHKRYCRLEEFNPRSKEQTINFIKWVGDETPKRGKKGVYKESTGKDKIYELWQKTGDPFYKAIIFIRELEKLLDTYIGDGITKGWIIGSDSRVHSSFKPYPATGQLNATEGGNILAVPKYGGMHSTYEYREIATKFRNCIVAKPNHTLLARDYSSFHALTIGVEAEDANYIRMVRNDIHSFVASHILANTLPSKFEVLNKKGHISINELKEMYLIEQTLDLLKDIDNWPNLPDNELRKKLKWIKEVHEFTRNRIAKSAILGIGFGMTTFKFLDLYKEHVKTMKFAELIFKILYDLFPNLFIFQKNICKLADVQSYLVSRYGYVRHFYHVYDRKRLDKYKEPKFGEEVSKDKRGNYWLKKPGGDAKEAIAFLPANHAFGKIKEAMRELEDLGLNEKYRLLLQTHDELMFEVPNEYLDEAIIVTKEIMEKPSLYIKNDVCKEGLICNTEAQVGKSWGLMTKVKE